MAIGDIHIKLEQYKRKFYQRELVKGLLINLSLFLIIFLSFNLLESFFWFGNIGRFILLSGIGLAFLVPFYLLILLPSLELIHIRKGLSERQMAEDLGKFFPEIADGLVNLLELRKIPHEQGSLIAASISQKSDRIQPFDFTEAIDFQVNRKFLYAFLIIVCSIGLISFINPLLIRDSTKRIVFFQKQYEKPSPFGFEIAPDLTAFQNENFDLVVTLTGNALPEKLFLELENGRRIKMNSDVGRTSFSYTFKNIQRHTKFRAYAAGFYSQLFEIQVFQRPEIGAFELALDYPKYTGLTDETFSNSGNAIIPEGTIVTWNLETIEADTVKMVIAQDTFILEQRTSNNEFTFSKSFVNSTPYEIRAYNTHASNKNTINYSLEVIKDEAPTIEVAYRPDTLLFSSVLVLGQITDDYGFSDLTLYSENTITKHVTTQDVKIKRDLNNQNFYCEWKPAPDTKDGSYEIWLAVRDNDQINGAKRVLSKRYYFRQPDQSELEEILSKNAENAEKGLSHAEKESEELNAKLDELENRLKSKKNLSWQEEKLVKEILNKREGMEKAVEKLAEEHEQLLNTKEQLSDQSQKIQEKSRQLQKLMDELLDEKTKALYDELEKLLEEKSSSEDVNELLSEIKSDEQTLEQELERALELFKRLKLESKLEETANKLEELGKEQEQLSEQKANTTEAQEKIAEEFEQIKEDMKALQEMNQALKNPEPLESLDQEQKEISEDLKELSQQMNKQSRSKTQQQQQKTGKKMKNMGAKMKEMQGQMEMEAMQENIAQLQNILDDLLKLSFTQEEIVNGFRGLNQTDPRYLELSQKQLELSGNAQVVKDSMIALSQRVIQISNFVTREVNQINRGLDQALAAIKERSINKATSHQRFAMTSMNNLALLLDDVLRQMQMSMAEAMGNPKPGNQSKPSPSLSKLQQQLSKQIEELKKSGKQGRKLSEELAKLAAEQAQIRKQMQQFGQQMEGKDGQRGSKRGDSGEDGINGKRGGESLKELIKQMEANEEDLVNKRLSQQLLNRQKEILTRMLEAEDAMKEQKQDQKREGETAEKRYNKNPPAYDEYLKARKKEIELLNTIPLDLTPFYKKEVNEYFKRLSEQVK